MLKLQVLDYQNKMAAPEGLEPSTFGFEDRHSIQLSYGAIDMERAISEAAYGAPLI
jgi:hypothetical protein